MAPRLPCLAGIFAAVVVFLAGCGGSSESPSHRLGPPQDPAHATKVSVPHVQLDASYVAYVASLCIESGTPIEPTGVELVKSSNMKIIDWGILDTASGAVGFLKGRLSSVAGLRHQPVQAICSRDSPNQLDVEVQISGPVAVSHGFQVNYRDGTKPGHLVTRLTLMLCSGTCPAT
jgi:hypothetical protein